MSLSRETQEMLQSAITKMVNRYISAEESNVTDFQIRVNGDNGELTIFDDDDNELSQATIVEWNESAQEQPATIEKTLRTELAQMQKVGLFDKINILKPYSCTLVDENKESIVDLIYIDDDMLVLDSELLQGLDEEMNEFLKHLLEE